MPGKTRLPLPEPILDATPEEIARRTLRRPPKKRWRNEEKHAKRTERFRGR